MSPSPTDIPNVVQDTNDFCGNHIKFFVPVFLSFVWIKGGGGGGFTGSMPAAHDAPKSTPASVDVPSAPAPTTDKVADAADDDLPF